MMGDIFTLKENRDFLKIYKKGKSFISPLLVTYILKNNSDNLRYGITTGKKIGNAVKRSRARRVIRAAFRECNPQLKRGYDIVFVARGKTPFVKSTQIKNTMDFQFNKAQIYKDKV